MDTLNKLYKEVEKLYSAEDGLSTLLEHAGYDPETKYTQDRLELYDNMRDLYRGLQALLKNHQDTINNLEYALEPLPVKISKYGTREYAKAMVEMSEKKTIRVDKAGAFRQKTNEIVKDEIEGRKLMDFHDMTKTAKAARL